MDPFSVNDNKRVWDPLFIKQNKANRHKSRAQFSNRQTDQQTNRVAYRVVCTRLKKRVRTDRGQRRMKSKEEGTKKVF